MTGRERLLSLIHCQATPRIPWTTLVDDKTRSKMPQEWREMPVLDFYRRIGCDIMAFGNYGLPPELRVIPPCRLVQPEVTHTSETQPDRTLLVSTRSPWGTLAAMFSHGHPVKYPVETISDLRVLKNIWLNSYFEETGSESEDSYNKVDTAIGDSGIYVYTLAPSPFQRVLEYDMGLINSYALLADYTAEFEELLAVMHSRRMQEYEICARRMSCEVFMPVENTSTTMISPALYEKYSLPQISDLAGIMHRQGKKLILHMCGLIRDLLPLIRQTGADGVNALTPAPVGNTSIEDALDVLGKDIIIWGGVLAPTIFHNPSFSRQNLEQALTNLFTPRVRSSHFLLAVGADGLETPLERFFIVRDWMNKNALI